MPVMSDSYKASHFALYPAAQKMVAVRVIRIGSGQCRGLSVLDSGPVDAAVFNTCSSVGGRLTVADVGIMLGEICECGYSNGGGTRSLTMSLWNP